MYLGLLNSLQEDSGMQRYKSVFKEAWRLVHQIIDKFIFQKAMEKESMKAEAPTMPTASLACFKR